MLSLLTPDGVALPVPSASSSLWMTLGRGQHGVGPKDQKVSRAAVELSVRASSAAGGPPSVWIRVLTRNVLFLSHPPASASAAPSPLEAVVAGKETEWRVGSTLYLLTVGKENSYPFTLRRGSEDLPPPTLSLFDAEMTQDVNAPVAASQQPTFKLDQQRASPARASPARSPHFPSLSHEIPATPIQLAATASQLPLTPRPTHGEADAEMKSDSSRARSSRKRPLAETVLAPPVMPRAEEGVTTPAGATPAVAAAAAVGAAAASSIPAVAAAAAGAASAAASSMQVAAPTAASAAAAFPPDANQSAAPDAADYDFPLDDDADTHGFALQDYNFATDHRADEAAAAAAAGDAEDSVDEPDKKKQKTNQAVVIKRSLDFLLAPAPLAPPPKSFLSCFAIFIVADGIGSRQLEILHANISKRGGVLLKELPKHRFHVVVDREAKKREKKRIETIQQTRGAAAAEAAAAANPSVGERKLNVLVLVSHNIRTKKQLTDVLARRARLQAASDSAHSVRHLGVPSASSRAAASPPPPSSPKPAGSSNNSPSSVASGSSHASAAVAAIKLRSQWQIHTVEWIIEAFKRNQLLPSTEFILDDADTDKIVASRKLDYPSSASVATSAAAAASSADTVAAPSDAADEDDEVEELYADEEETIAPTNAAAISAWNANIAAQLKETAEKYSAQHGEHFRAIAFRRAAGVIGSLPYALKDVNTIRDIKGLGPSTLDEARAIIETGRSSRLEALKNDPVLVVHQLLQTVHGVGPKTAEKLYAQGIRTIEDLRTKVKLTTQQETYLRHYDELRSPIPRGEVTAFEKMVNVVLHQIHPQLQLTITGSYRRGKATCGDIDCLITHPDPDWKYRDAHSAAAASSRIRLQQEKTHVAHFLEELLRRLHALDLLTDDLVTSSSKQRFKTKNIFESKQISEMSCCIGRIPADPEHGWGGKHRRIDFKFYHITEFPFALLYFTGSKDFNRQMRLYANIKFGYSLSDHALSPYIQKGKEKVASGIGLPCASEADVFKHLKMEYVPPTNRDKIPAIFLRK